MRDQMSPLRQRMLDDMRIRNMSQLTQYTYVRAVANYSAFHGRAPDKLNAEHVRSYRLHLIERGLKANSLNPIMGGLRFFYATTLGNKQVAEAIPYARKEDTLPAVLTQDQVVRLLKAESDPMMRTIFTTIYAAGLRISEAARLTVTDINSQRLVIHIRQAKGHKDRYVMLSEQLLNVLRSYWKRRRPSGSFLFPGDNPDRPITVRTLQRAFREAADRAGLGASAYFAPQLRNSSPRAGC